ncbi:gamma-type small acid-soluble spore protein (plasmid) [Priestia aryabhattai]|uniref:gamma-type small acid-soluble spore protein n=1 Tax=Priestia TaxID=2800373 RepID=UPI000BFDDF8D|nr:MULTISPECIES: gamma-type small acid-soluble spore protein [Priestia]MBY0214764.1 gamma-type small acid-soluble spore protein [Priestia aryabhattai]MCM2978984.1 gamma-type small acid-soluble spore protein [Priestia aryabhattai]PHF72247.1 gamma-type small acid-soluble spore protein [Priestia aryabhattai]
MENNKYANKTASGTDVQHVKQKNAQASSSKYGTEFASETDVQHVKRQNAQASANKNQNSNK